MWNSKTLAVFVLKMTGAFALGGFISRWGTCKGLILLFGRAGLLFFVDGWVMIKSAGLDDDR